MDILKSSEVFLSEPLSLLRNSIVQIVSLTTGSSKAQVTADMLRNKTQITVMNSEKMYKLLKRVNTKRENLISAKEEPLFGQLTLKA